MYDEALELYNQSLNITKEIGEQQRIDMVLNSIGRIHHIKGKYDQALELGYQSLKIAKEIGDRYTVGVTLNNIAMIYYNKGDHEDALYYVLQAWDILYRRNATEFQKSATLISSIEKELGIEEFYKLE